MCTIFDMDATFRPSRASEYTAMQLCRVLELEGLYEGANTYCFLRGIRVRCHRLSLIPRRIWGLTPAEALEWLRENMIPYYPLGVYQDRTGNERGVF